MAETQEPQTTEADKAEAERIATITKKGFDLKARLEGRGLRRATITLYLDEELGAELGRAEEIKNNLGMVTGLDQVGILGDLDKFSRARAAAIKQYDDAVEKTPDMPEADRNRGKEALDGIVAGFDEKIAELEGRKAELVEELTKTGLTIKLRAVPPVIQKDTHRKAKQTLGIEGKTIPEDMRDRMPLAEVAHLLTVLVQSITDNQTGEVNDDLTYEDAVALMDLLPPSQWARLDAKIGEVQFTDAISRSIESQEDFS